MFITQKKVVTIYLTKKNIKVWKLYVYYYRKYWTRPRYIIYLDIVNYFSKIKFYSLYDKLSITFKKYLVSILFKLFIKKYKIKITNLLEHFEFLLKCV